MRKQRSDKHTMACLRLLLPAVISVACVLFSLSTSHSQGGTTLKGKSRTVLAFPDTLVDVGTVTLKKDSDHDGMPDDAETANGTNPNDPSDADGDADGDGLSNGDEVAIGSGVNNADTDGDGVSDGEEMRLGYNPNDATNTPPVNATIVSIQVTPSPLELSINSILGAQPGQLQVTGTLNTGTTVDLTTAPGTTYTSLNENVALVDDVGTAGPVTLGSTAIVVQNGTLTVQVPVTVSNYTPVSIAELFIPGYANSVAVDGNYVFVAAGSTGLQIVDVTDARLPRIVGTFNTPGNANDVKIVGNLAFVADGDAGLSIIDVSNKTAPLGVGSVDTPGIAEGVVVAGTLAYIADGLTGLRIIDVSNPASPLIVGAVDTPGTARSVGVSGTIAVVCDDLPSPALRVINVQQPLTPVTVGNLSLSAVVKNMVVRDGFAYVALNTVGLRVVSLANPAAPQIIGTIANFSVRDVALVGNIVFGSLVPNQGSPVTTLNLSSQPIFRGMMTLADVSTGQPLAVAADEQYVYLTKQNSGSTIDNGASGVTSLIIGRYQPKYDRAGVAPSTSVVSPQPGQTVVQGKTITITADAGDDVEVERVQFLVDDVVIANDRIFPYEASYLVPLSTATHTIKTIATDLNGVSSESAPITITTTPNPPPVVSLLSPQPGSILIAGRPIELLAQASDDGSIQRIVFTAGGVTLPADTEAPFKTNFTVPANVSSLTISATATDDKGSTATATQTFSVTPALTTTVTGRVVDSMNQPIAGASVSVFGSFSTQTILDGSFSIVGVPSSQGSIVAIASAVVSGEPLRGASISVAPVPGGTTNVGTILIRNVSYETAIGNLVNFGSGDFNNRSIAITLPFSFTFYGVTYSQVFVGTNGYLTFGAASTVSTESPTAFANGSPRIAPLFDDWGPDQTTGRGVFVNTQLPGKVIFTWQNVEHAVNQFNDDTSEEGNFQVVLFSNGRIQFGYAKVETLGGLVGISPGGTPQLVSIKHSASTGVNVGSTAAPYEQFFGIGEFPFDLQHSFITYTPNFGGYDVQSHRAPQTTVSGRILDPNGEPVGGARVTVLNRTVITELDGSFSLQKVPAAEGPLLVKSIWVAPDGQLFQGQSVATPAVVSGVTNVGDLTLSARGEAFDSDFGQLVPHASGSFPRTEFQLQFPFRFYGQSFYGRTVSRVFLNSQGYLTLAQDCITISCNNPFGLANTTANDLNFAFSDTPIIAPFFSTLDPGNTGQVFVKSLPDKWVMTFVNVQQPGRPEINTFQVALHADGTIHFAYNGIGTKHAHVGLSVGRFEGLGENSRTINWNSTPVRRMPYPYPFFETFTGDFGGLPGNNFDLDRNVMVFFPNDDGSYDVIRQQFTGPTPASKILFDSSVDGDVDLFSINPDGSDRVNLTNSRSDDFDARLSPDGTRIAFDSYRDDPDGAVEEIYVMKLDGTGLVRLTNNNADDYNPIWSPDGTKILFQSNRNGDYQIFVMNSDGTDQRSLTGYAGDSSPVWSPDGTKILVTSDRDGVGGLYIMNADGTGITHLANTGTFGGNSDAFGTWSPDGTRIAFHSYRNGEADIFVVNADGSGLFNLTNDPSGDFAPRWSPDGTRILFLSFRDNNFELYVINADGSGLVRLTNTLIHESTACWSPDGTQIAFTNQQDSDSASVFIVNADGTGTRTLVNNGARNFVLEWKTMP